MLFTPTNTEPMQKWQEIKYVLISTNDSVMSDKKTGIKIQSKTTWTIEILMVKKIFTGETFLIRILKIKLNWSKIKKKNLP